MDEETYKEALLGMVKDFKIWLNETKLHDKIFLVLVIMFFLWVAYNGMM